MNERVSDEFSSLEVTDDEGRPSRLGELWATRAAAVVWVRQFG